MGSPWVGDKSQFGYKMLLKMGWKDGNGLGANQDGTVKPIVAAKNIENRGIGAKRSSDNWIHGASDFEKLLKRLNEANSSNTDTKSDENGALSAEEATKDAEKEASTGAEDETAEQEEHETQRRGPRMRYTRMLKAKGIIRSEHSADRLAEVLAVTRKEQLNVYIADSDPPVADEPQDGAKPKKAKKARANEGLRKEEANQEVKKDNDEAEISAEGKEATRKKNKKKSKQQKPAEQSQNEEQEKQNDDDDDRVAPQPGEGLNQEEEEPVRLSKKERKALRKQKQKKEKEKEKGSENQE